MLKCSRLLFFFSKVIAYYPRLKLPVQTPHAWEKHFPTEHLTGRLFSFSGGSWFVVACTVHVLSVHKILCLIMMYLFVWGNLRLFAFCCGRWWASGCAVSKAYVLFLALFFQKTVWCTLKIVFAGKEVEDTTNQEGPFCGSVTRLQAYGPGTEWIVHKWPSASRKKQKLFPPELTGKSV